MPLCSDGCANNFHIRRHGGRMRYAPTVFGGRLFLLGIIFQIMRTELGKNWANRCRGVSHTPFTWANNSIIPLCLERCDNNFHFRRRGGRMRYAPTVFGENPFLLGSSFNPCERRLPRIVRTSVGAYHIRPSRERTTPSCPFARNDALTIFIFAAMEGVCDTPLQFLAEFFSIWGYSRMAYLLRFPANYW